MLVKVSLLKIWVGVLEKVHKSVLCLGYRWACSLCEVRESKYISKKASLIQRNFPLCQSLWEKWGVIPHWNHPWNKIRNQMISSGSSRLKGWSSLEEPFQTGNMRGSVIFVLDLYLSRVYSTWEFPYISTLTVTPFVGSSILVW